MNIPSPCTGICKLDENDICLGCFRSRGEIARWTQMTCSEQLFVIAALDNRKKGVSCSQIDLGSLLPAQEVKAR